MVQLKKILVAFDGSKHGLKALDAAKKLAEDNHALLTVLYVHDDIYEKRMSISTTNTGDEFLYRDPGPLINDEPLEPVEERNVAIDKIPFQIISIAKTKLVGLDMVTYERLVGKPSDEIVNYAADNNIDVIVIGNRGIGALEKFVTGSVSNKVIKHAKCSVFIVK